MNRPPNAEPSQSAANDGDQGGKPTVLDTIRALHAKTITGGSLSQMDRRACVEHFTLDGFGVPHIADILKVSERTIARDRKAIQESYALNPDPKLVPLFVGRLVNEMENCIGALRRTARDKDTPPADRIQADISVFKIVSETIQRLQQLGYLPTATQRFEANLRHEINGLQPLDDLLLEVKRLEVVAEQTQDVEMVQKLVELRKTTAHANLAMGIAQLSPPNEVEGLDHAPPA